MHKHYPEYANFGAVDLQGNVFAGAVPLRRPVNAANMFWFQQTMKTRDFTIGGYQICRITGLEVIVFGQPVFDRTGKMRCLLFASMDLKWLNRLWEHIKPLPDSTFTITDDSGIVLLRYPLPADKWIGKNMANVPIISAMLSRESGASETDGLDAKNRLYAFTTTKTPGGRLHMAVGMSKKAALTPIYIDLAVSLLVLALIAVLGIFLARVYSNRFIMKPIRELQNAAERFSSGDYSSRANLTDGENELIAFANIFDKMAETIETKTRELNVMENRLDFLLSSSPAVIYTCRASGDYGATYISANVKNQLGFEPNEFTAEPGFWAEHIHPEDRERVFAELSHLFKTGHHKHEYRFQHKDGDYRWMYDECKLIRDAFNNPVEIVGYWIDITERKKTETLIKNILESVDEGFIIIDTEYKIISANRAYCEQLKLCCEDIIGRFCYEVSHHRDKPCFMADEECAPMHTFKTGAPHMAIHTHYDKDGSPIYIETKSFPMKDSSGHVFAAIETLNNITEKRKLEEQLRHAQKMEAIGTLVGGIAHDFNNMLNIIIGYGGLMQMKMKPDDPQMSQLKEILAAGDRAAQLTKGLLAFSRKQVLEIRTVNLNEIVEGFKKMLRRIIGEDIDLKIMLSEKALIIKADIVQIEQVLMNLAANARDAMPKGGVLTIETRSIKIDSEFIKTHGYGEPGMYALITVSDTGIGMDEKTRERIFEPYFTTKEMGRGTGLGLAIVYGIVKQHNGYINCYSEPGEGTTFRIYIPLVKVEAEKLETEETLAPKGGTETILIAEDDANVRGLIRNILEGFGYTVIEAVDGEDAVKRFKENKDRIQLLLFDLIMPKKNGKDAYEDIKGIRPNIRAIFISGYAKDIIQRFGIEEGIEFITKPVLPTELLRKVREELDK
jgi:PAS domain S-box-containing protein